MFLTDKEVREQVRELARADELVWRQHAEDRLSERGIDRGMVKDCLVRGYFVENPVIPNRPGAIEYKFTMQAVIDGEHIRVAASLNPDTHVVVITLFDPS